MRRFDVIAEICDYMLELGWGPYQSDHEDANGQFEMNWEFDNALITADKHSFFKFMTKSVAEKHGFRATFMPKPLEGLTAPDVMRTFQPGTKRMESTYLWITTKSLDSQIEVLIFLGYNETRKSSYRTNPTSTVISGSMRQKRHQGHLGSQYSHLDKQQSNPHGESTGSWLP